MSDIASQPVMSMYSTDPATGLTIISPRVYRLRQLQACDGTNISELRLEQRGLAPITYMHHVSKIIEGNTESYRVRICRTCSGLPTLSELGSYTDVESALLVNDVHELMQDRTKQLHLLCVEDMKYFNSIAVRRRGSPHDLLITSVLQERLWKKSSAASATAKKLLKEAANNESDISSAGAITPKPVSEVVGAIQDIIDTTLASVVPPLVQAVEPDGAYPIITKDDGPIPNDTNVSTIGSTVAGHTAPEVRIPSTQLFCREITKPITTAKPTIVLPVTETAPFRIEDIEIKTPAPVPVPTPVPVSVPVPIQHYKVVSESYSDIGHSLNKSDALPLSRDSTRGYTCNEEDEIPNHVPADPKADSKAYNSILFSNENNDGKFVPTSNTGDPTRPGVDRPTSQALSRASRIVEQFKANLVRYHTTFLQWGFFQCSSDIDVMFLSLTEFVDAELTNIISSASMKRSGSRVGLSSDSSSNLAAVKISLCEAWAVGRAPRSTLLSTIASVFPGNSVELQVICKKVAAIIPQDTPTVSQFNDLYALAAEEVQKAESEIRMVESQLLPSDTSVSSLKNEQDEGQRVINDGETSITYDIPVKIAPVGLNFKDCDEFIRQSYNAASYFDHSLRLCAWDGELSGVQEAEVKLHGIYAQLENRFIAVTQFLLVVTSANAAAIKCASSRRSASSTSVVRDAEYLVEREAAVELLDNDLSDLSAPGIDDDIHQNIHTNIHTNIQNIHQEINGSVGSAIDNESESTVSASNLENSKADMLDVLSSLCHSEDGDEKYPKNEIALESRGVSSGTGTLDIALTNESYLSMEAKWAELLKKTTMCVTYCILALTSAASVAWRLCGDSLSASSCIRACSNFLPILVENVFDPSILQEFIQRHLDLMTSIILHSGRMQMLSSGFGILGPSNNGGRNFVFSRYRPADLNGNRITEDGQEEEPEREVKESSSSSTTGQSHTELRLLAFSLGGEIVKQSRRCFASFPRQLTGPAAMVHFEAAFRAYVSIFLASLALEESDLLLKLGYTVEKLLTATNDVLSSLQERITRQNCALVSTHTLISLHGMAEACIFHSKRHVDCANTIFMIVRSCRLILWGCSSRFVLAKMLLEHIAEEESKRIFADDMEQAAHLLTLKTAADQAFALTVDPGPTDSVPGAFSVGSIFAPFEQQDSPHSSGDAEDDFHPVPVEKDRGVGKKHRPDVRTDARTEGRTDGDEKGVRADSSSSSSSTVFGQKKRKINGSVGINGNGSGKVVRLSEAKSKVGLTISTSSSALNEVQSFPSSVYGNSNDHQIPLPQYHSQMNNGNGNGNYGIIGKNNNNSYNMMTSSVSPYNSSLANSSSLSTLSSLYGYPPRSMFEHQMMMTLSGSNSNMTPMVPGVSQLWVPEDIDTHHSIPGLINSSGITGTLGPGSGYNHHESYHNIDINHNNLNSNLNTNLNSNSISNSNSNNNVNAFFRHNSAPIMSRSDLIQNDNIGLGNSLGNSLQWYNQNQNQNQQWLQQQRNYFQQQQHH